MLNTLAALMSRGQLGKPSTGLILLDHAAAIETALLLKTSGYDGCSIQYLWQPAMLSIYSPAPSDSIRVDSDGTDNDQERHDPR